jgi:beta-mannosidase
MPTTCLDGGRWELRGCLGASWEWYVGPDAPADGWLPGRVPGSVLDDLMRAGAVPDPYVGLNSLACEWVAERAWVYRRRFRAGPLRPGQRAVLRFGGVDHTATVWADGVLAGRHQGMYGTFEVDVTEQLRRGADHLLTVVIDPAPDMETQVGRTSRVRLHKARVVYGWDFCPRLPHQGIWRPVHLETWSGARLRRVCAATVTAASHREGHLTVQAGLQAGGEDGGGADAELRLRLLAGRELAGQARCPVAPGGEARLELSLAEPRLWWPNGMGQPYLYRAELDLSGPGVPGTTTGVDVGFRRIELAPNTGAPPAARPYTFVVNGRRMYARGWNWVPIDALYGVPRPAKLAHLLDLAARARVNLLRVWGGGLIESEDFYRRCDELGLLVWQEFSLSSSCMDSEPAGDPAFVSYLAGEAARIVPGLRHHPSLALWCGGNELAAGGVPLDEAAPALAGLRDAVARLDPGRPWLPTSPSGPCPENRLAAIEADPGGQHDVHGPWEHQGLNEHHRLYNAGTALFHSEFGVEGMTNRRALDALVPAGRRWPPGRSNPVYAHLGAWWNNLPLVQEAFGGRLSDLDDIRRASQYLQADGLRYAVEAARRRAWRCSGTIPWQFNESYPNAWCTAAVDHRGDPKPAYYWVKRAYQSPYVSASFGRQAWRGAATMRANVWAGADWPVPLAGTVTARVAGLDGTVVTSAAWQVDDGDGQPRALGEITAGLGRIPGDLFLLDLRLSGPDGTVTQVNRYLMTKTADLGPVLDVPAADVAVSIREQAGAWQVELAHRGGPAALGIVLEDDRSHEAPGWATFSDNLIDLLPGEHRRIDVLWREAPATGRRLRAGGWNTTTLRIP